MLEQQQTQLVAGLRELYRRLQQHEPWPGPALLAESGGHPLTHDILHRLGLVHTPLDDSVESVHGPFEDDFLTMQRQLVDRGAPLQKRSASSTSPESDDEDDGDGEVDLDVDELDGSALPGHDQIQHEHPMSTYAPHSFSSLLTSTGSVSDSATPPMMALPPTPPANSPLQVHLQRAMLAKTPAVLSTQHWLAQTPSMLPPLLPENTPWASIESECDSMLRFEPAMPYDATNFMSIQPHLTPSTNLTPGPSLLKWGEPQELDFSTFIRV